MLKLFELLSSLSRRAMGVVTKLIICSAALVALLAAAVYYALPKKSAVVRLEPQWWGPGSKPSKEDTSVKPFKINVSEDVLEDLKRRLDNARILVPPLEGVSFQYGFNSDTLKKVVEYWRTEYAWREREAYLNQYPQFKTRVQGLDLHYVHVRPSQEALSAAGGRSVPLLLLHGWPGSVREFYSLVPLLTDAESSRKAGFALELVMPSLPGYGWSQAPVRPGLGPAQIACVFAQLMERLGHRRWYVQGGDWGSVIGLAMATMYPEKLYGVHSNMCASWAPLSILKTLLGSLYPRLVVDERHEDRVYPLGKVFANLMLETGYMHLQATKPDTVGAALADSPTGLAAYILEKFSTWTNPKWKYAPDGGLGKRYSYTDLLDNVMVYWVTGSITTSMRLYAETFGKRHRELQLEMLPTTVPVACAMFRNELFYQPESLLRDKYTNLVRATHFDDGGHFAAFEVPELLAEDVWTSLGQMETTRNTPSKKK